MLTLNAAPTFVWPAKITVPGQVAPAEISVTWRHKTLDAYDAWLASAPNFAGKGGDAAFLAEVMANWSGVDHGFDLAHLETLLAMYPASAAELLKAYQTGLLESRAKN